jgi:hypothetical protein
MADLTTLYRAVDSPFRELIPKSFEGNIGTGRWYTPDIDIAKSYATKPGSTIYSMDVAPSDITKSNKLKNRLISKGYDWMDNAATLSDDVVLASKELLNKGKPSINWGKTLGTNLELLGNQGLGFLKNNAFRTLAMLGSLPAQVGIMTLSPTTMGNAEIPQMPQGSPKQINQGEGDGGYRASRPASERRHTGHGKSGMGRDPRDRMAMGGLIDLYRYGGFI